MHHKDGINGLVVLLQRSLDHVTGSRCSQRQGSSTARRRHSGDTDGPAEPSSAAREKNYVGSDERQRGFKLRVRFIAAAGDCSPTASRDSGTGTPWTTTTTTTTVADSHAGGIQRHCVEPLLTSVNQPT